MTDATRLAPPGDVAHLKRLIEAWAPSNPESFTEPSQARRSTQGRLRRLIGVTVIAGALDGLRSDDGLPRFGIKGGSAMEIRFGFSARASRDLDAAFRGDLADALELIEEALEGGWNGFTGVLGSPEEITRAKVTPAPLRVSIKLRYRAKPFITIPLELSTAEGQSMDAPEMLASAVAPKPVQLAGPERIALLPARYQVAQKLHACTEDTGEPPNDRVRDLADLMMLRALAVPPSDLAQVRSACIDISLGDAITAAQSFVAEIDSAR